MRYIITQQAAISHLKKLFSGSSKNAISLSEAYIATERNLNEAESNKQWIRNEVSKLKQHGFIKTRLGKHNGKQMITHLELTEQGKVVLNRADGQLSIPEVKTEAKTEVKNGNGHQQADVTQLITKLSQDNPNRKITYDINGGTISLEH